MNAKGQYSNSSLIYLIDNKTEIELSSLGNAFISMSNEYRVFLSRFGEEVGSKERLILKSIKQGSFISEFVSNSAALIPLIADINLLFEFGNYLKNIFDFLNNNKTNGTENFSIKTLENLKAILNPGVESKGSINISIKGNNNEVLVLNMDETGLKSLENKISDLVLAELNRSEIKSQLLSTNVHQIKKLNTEKVESFKKVKFSYTSLSSMKTRRGNDKGVIEKISSTPLKVSYLKAKYQIKMKDAPSNPLQNTYLIDVDVKYIDDKPKSYLITKVHNVV